MKCTSFRYLIVFGTYCRNICSCPCLRICIYSIVSSPVAIISHSIMKKATPTLKKTTPASPRPSPYPSSGGSRVDKVGHIRWSDPGAINVNPLTNMPVSCSKLLSQSPTHQSIVPLQLTQRPAEDLGMVPYTAPQAQLPTELLPYPLLHPTSSQNLVMGLPATSWNGTVENSDQPLPIQSGLLLVDKGKAKLRSFLLRVD
jgi:hypothetical protein